jgi:hypothetical protein
VEHSSWNPFTDIQGDTRDTPLQRQVNRHGREADLVRRAKRG